MAPHKAEEVDRAPDKLPSRPACRPVFVTSLSQCLLSGSGCSCQVAMGLCHCVLVVTEATGCIGRRVAVDRERSLEFAYGCVLLEVLLSSTTFLAGHAPPRLVFDKLPCQRSGICLHSLCGSLGLVSPRVCLYRNVLWEFHGRPARPLTEPSVCDVCVLWWLLPLCSTLKDEACAGQPGSAVCGCVTSTCLCSATSGSAAAAAAVLLPWCNK